MLYHDFGMLEANKTTESKVFRPMSVGVDVNELAFPDVLSLLLKGITTGKLLVEL